MNKQKLIWGVIAIFIIGMLWWGASKQGAGNSTPTTVPDPSVLPGIQTSEAPWLVEVDHLAARLAADSLKPQTMEGQVLHIHQHLDLIVHGKPVEVPTNIGIHQRAGWLSTVHSHDTTGIIHVESPFKATFTLGQVFDIWGVRFTSECLGGYCTDESESATSTLQVYVNGELFTGDPRILALGERQEIAIIFGTATETPAIIPSTYTFPEGY